MKNPFRLPILFVALITAGCSPSPTPLGQMNFPEGSVQHVVRAEEIQWKPCPPNLPSDCEIALLDGSPKEPDMFTLRFRVNGNFVMPPHTHPKDERVTVIQGKAYVGFGKDATRETAKGFEPGDYYVNARGAIHAVWADSATVIQITGIGPWVADYVEK